MTDDHRQALPRGTVLGDYEVERLIGHGGFGLTYLGVHSRIRSMVAIKEYLPAEIAFRETDHSVTPKSTSDRELFEWGRKRFLDEARALGLFRHANIVRVLDYFEAHGTAYIVMDYVDGRNLDTILKESGLADENDLKRLLLPLLDGLARIHRESYLHRDIKPSNIMIQEDGTPVLIDFGAARVALGERSESLTSIVTPGYAPIEQYSSSGGDQGPWTDIYALGAVAYRALTGKRPPDATDRLRKDRMVPASVAAQGRCHPKILEAIDWALAVNEEDRPQSVGDWSAALLVEDDGEQEAEATPDRHEEPRPPPPAPDRSPPPPQPAAAPRPKAEPRDAARRRSTPSVRLVQTLVIGAAIAALAAPALFERLGGEQDDSPMSSPPPSLPAPEVKRDPVEIESGLALSRDDRIQVQRALNELRYDVGTADGVFGTRTRAAIRNFQERNNYDTTGYLTQVQLDSLKSALHARTTLGGVFDDCDDCPDMVIVPPGEFMMGSPDSEARRDSDEGPQRKIRIAKPFAVGKFEVTRAEYSAFVAETGHSSGDGCQVWKDSWINDATLSWRNPGYAQSEDDPVACVNWHDATAYAAWLSRKTGEQYRLLAEAEWEYAARAGTTTPWYCGANEGCVQGAAWHDGNSGGQTHPVGLKAPNAFGLYDMLGNLSEWVQDCNNDYSEARGSDASPLGPADCTVRIARGGAWNSSPRSLRAAFRINGLNATDHVNIVGFRVARIL